VDSVSDDVRRRFRLNEERMEAIKAFSGAVGGAEAEAAWRSQTAALIDMLRRRPLLDDQTWLARQEGRNTQIKLVGATGEQLVERLGAPINLGDTTVFEREIETLVRIAGFAPRTGPLGAVGEAIKHRLTSEAKPTYAFDQAATIAAQGAAAEAVLPVIENIAKGQRVFNRGDVLEPSQYRIYAEEIRRHRESAGVWTVWSERASLAGAVSLIVALLMGYVGTFSQRIMVNLSRVLWLVGVVLASQVLACVGTTIEPRYLALTAVVPTVLVAVLMSIAYNRRTAVSIGSLVAVLNCVSLDQPVGVFVLLLVGVGAAVWRLPEIRDRQSLVTMSLWVAVSLTVAAWITGMLERPFGPRAISETVRDALLAGTSGLLVGGVTLFVLPVIERVFDITTNLTLIELRDPKQPLLRELQQRAPGTYNHSLNVASIAESAADAIGANGLLTYVGALYHDIGKMNKPEYFVENQSGGPNKHDKLSPAMSLLVIVGHVKDGSEIARSFGLPKVLRHFIDAHHGTTLVEYFYHRARKQAKEVSDEGKEQPVAGEEREHEDERLPDEVDYRYPGPKPRTKEVAILMLADAVESATRTLTEPTSSRIESLVRSLADKRLMDGQFDECDLTLRELRAIVDSISKSVTSIYHGRISYPSGGSKQPKTGPAGKDGAKERTA
jgi:putative nucleotidyltransferase with HDIG domain